MGPKNLIGRCSAPIAIWCIWCAMDVAPVSAQVLPTGISIVEFAGTVQVSPAGQPAWSAAFFGQSLKPGDRVRTREHSRLTLRLSANDTVRFHDITEFQIQPAAGAKKKSALSLLQGMLYLFHRGKATDYDFNTPTASAAIRGTEFNLEAQANGRTIVTMLDGTVELSNAQGPITVNSGEQGIADPGSFPTKSSMLEAASVIQWCFYYPGILDSTELGFNAQEEQTLSESLAAYRAGDLRQALAAYPAGREPAGAAETIYRAGLLLAVGEVEQTETLLNALPLVPNPPANAAPPENLAAALRQLIATVRGKDWQRSQPPQSATEWLAESYYQQSGSHLPEALQAARQAAEKSQQFGFATERVAELEFSFGRTADADAALEKSLALAPRNAQAHALKGFILAARNRIPEAIASFGRAIDLDGALGNAWLGRGLCRIRQGDAAGGRQDLQIAAALEPQRAVLRSYLAKAYSDKGDYARASHEIQLAKSLDPKDPTAWLYSALLNQQNNRINAAVHDLEKSQELSDNRSIYRSRLMLDQDQAVRSANLANMHRDAGMVDVSLRDASRAVNYDYANYSAHLFLANSYDQFRDPNRINLRYETPAESEYLLANLLAPASAGTLSQSISQQEYSKLFERDRLGVTSATEYLSRGAWTERGAQFGVFGNSSYAFEALYRSDPGQRPNNDFQERELRFQWHQQLTPQDSLYFRAILYDAEGGDVVQYYSPTNANLGLRTQEKQEPIIHVGYHHEWNPGVHTLLLAGRIEDRFSVENPMQPTLFIIKDDGITPSFVQPITINETYRSVEEIFSAELQQIWQTPNHNTIVGARFQSGDFHLSNRQTDPVAGDSGVFFPTNGPAALQDFRGDFQRFSFYGYHYWQVAHALQLAAGLAYDHITFPENFRAAPVSQGKETVHQLSPKTGLIWAPAATAAFRFAYTRSLSGAGEDQTFLLEPSQVAGFNQSFRSIIPESVGGAEAGARFETYDLSLEQRWPTRTYLGISGDLLKSSVQRTLGVFDYTGATDFTVPSGTHEQLDYEEKSLLVTLNQLLGDEWSVGARYRLSKAELASDFVGIPDAAFITDPLFRPRQRLEAILHQLSLQTIYNHPSGFFGQFQALWHLQSNSGYPQNLPGDDFWQFNVFAGYRLPRRRAELGVGVLNLTDRDYRLNPLTLYNELPRERTFVARFSLYF